MKKNSIVENFNKRQLEKQDVSIKKFNALKKDTQLVWTDNDIALKLVMPFSARQLKVIDYAITEIQGQNVKTEDDKMVIEIADIIDFLQLKSSGSAYKDIEEDIRIIASTKAWWRYNKDNPKEKMLFSFFMDVKEVENSKGGTLSIRFFKEFLDKLYNTEVREIYDKDGKLIEKIGFNFYELWNTRRLKSKYSILLYKKCNVWKTAPRGYFEYPFEDMKKDFLLTDYVDENGKEHKYTYGYINKNCLETAIKEINEHTDIHISKIDTYPNKKKVEKLKIFLNAKSSTKIEKRAEDNFDNRDEYFSEKEEKAHDISIDKQVKREEKRIEAREKARIIKQYYKRKEEEEKIAEERAKEEEIKEINRIVQLTELYGLSAEEMRHMTSEEVNKWIEERKDEKIDMKKAVELDNIIITEEDI